jgi:hypothetical protein
VGELPARGSPEQGREPLGDRRVGSAAKPPFELADHGRMIGPQRLGKPEAQNAFDTVS